MNFKGALSVPLGAVLGAVPVLVGAMIWLGVMAAKVDDTAAKVLNLQERDDRLLELAADIRERLARIEGRLNHK